MKLTDAKFKGLIAFLLKNKAELITLTDYFEYQDIQNGKLLIPDYLINVGIKEKILNVSNVNTYLKNYSILFQNGYILLDLKLNLKQLGPVSGKYMISIKDFNFSPNGTRIYATFKEDVISHGNMVQSMALKALIAKNTGIQKAIQFTNCDFVFVDGHNLMIDLSKFDAVKKASEMFELNYIDCEAGQLKFNFCYCG